MKILHLKIYLKISSSKNKPSFFDNSNNSFDVLFTISQLKKSLYLEETFRIILSI